jgi:membrane associated rhomboid family serine protease
MKFKIRGFAGWMVVVSTVVFFLQHLWGGWLVQHFGLTPTLVLHEHRYWQLLTYQFLHAGILQWLFNMLILWMIGGMLESQWGAAFFFRFFLITSAGAGLCVLAFAPHSTSPVIGLTATLFGLLAAFALSNPNSVMYIYFLFPVKAWQAMGIFALIEFFLAMEGGNAAMTSVANLSGMGLGYAYVRWGSNFDRRIERFFSGLPSFTPKPAAKKSPVALYEATDDLISDVDRILDKVSKKGADSLTDTEKAILNRYTQLRH